MWKTPARVLAVAAVVAGSAFAASSGGSPKQHAGHTTSGSANTSNLVPVSPGPPISASDPLTATPVNMNASPVAPVNKTPAKDASSSGKTFAFQHLVSQSAPPTISAQGLAIAKTITEAQLKTAPAEVQKYLTTPVRVTHDDSFVQTAGSPPSIVLTASGSSSVPPGCYSWDDYFNSYNIYGFVLQTWGSHFDNWCFGPTLMGWIIYTNPTAYPYQNSHWGWSTCGTQDYYDNVAATNSLGGIWEWQAGGQFGFGYLTCNLTQGHYSWGHIYGNGGYGWYTN